MKLRHVADAASQGVIHMAHIACPLRVEGELADGLLRWSKRVKSFIPLGGEQVETLTLRYKHKLVDDLAHARRDEGIVPVAGIIVTFGLQI